MAPGGRPASAAKTPAAAQMVQNITGAKHIVSYGSGGLTVAEGAFVSRVDAAGRTLHVLTGSPRDGFPVQYNAVVPDSHAAGHLRGCAESVASRMFGGETMVIPLVLEGTWEEIRARADEFRGCRVRLMVLSPKPVSEQPETAPRAGVRDGAPQDYPVTPFFTTDECSAPIDLRPLAKGTIVPFVDGGQLPPRLPAELREEGNANV